MGRNLIWPGVFGVWLLGAVGSAFVLFIELSDGSKPGPATTWSVSVLFACVAAAVVYLRVVPRASRPPPSTWILAVLVCLGLMLVVGGFALMLALGAIRG